MAFLFFGSTGGADVFFALRELLSFLALEVQKNFWLLFAFGAIAMIQRVFLKWPLRLIVACQLEFLAFVLHHGTSILRRVAALLRILANELRDLPK